MDYKVMRVSLIGYSNVIYRDFYVNEEINLEKLGIAILSSFLANHDGYFYFTSNDELFVPYKYRDKNQPNYHEFRHHILKDIPLDETNSFYLIYDLAQNYQFICTLGNDIYEGKIDEGEDIEEYRIVLIKGEGQGIFEGMAEELNNFMKTGKVPEKEPSNITFEKNYSKEKYFKPIDVEFLNRLMVYDIFKPSREEYDQLMENSMMSDEMMKKYIDDF